MSSEHETTLRLSNTIGKDIQLILEPWGDIYPFAVTDEYVIAFFSEEAGEVEMVLGEDLVTVFGWAGCRRKLFKNGAPLDVDIESQPPVPKMPPGMSSRRFIDTILGLESPS